MYTCHYCEAKFKESKHHIKSVKTTQNENAVLTYHIKFIYFCTKKCYKNHIKPELSFIDLAKSAWF